MKASSSIAMAAAIMTIGTAGTTFAAAANPFSDVPSDSWAYDAVTQLAADGVIDGYPDGTFRGERNITRYEMAQMVAKAMAKTDVSAADKAMIDKLAAEFADELDNLGVRVANLERNADVVAWRGEMRVTEAKSMIKHGKDSRTHRMELRLKPSAQLNDHWYVRGRIDARLNYAQDSGQKESHHGDFFLKQLDAEGHYGNWMVELGKLPIWTEQGIIMDDNLTGAQLTYNTKQFGAVLSAGRLDKDLPGYLNDTGDFYSAKLLYKPGKFTLAGEYVGINSGEMKGYTEGGRSKKAYDDDSNAIWGVGASYRFDKNIALATYYGDNTKGGQDNKFGRLINAELDYKGAQRANAGTYGLYLAYRHLGPTAVISTTFNGMQAGWKGWEVGGQYTFAKNIVGTLLYVDGKTIADDEQDTERVFGRMQFFF